MNNLESLVPPLELCKQIPAGKFEDSALVWWGACVYPRLYPDGVRFDKPWHKRGTIPAPTVAEILERLTANGLDVPAIQYDGVLWKAFYTYHNSGNPMTPQTGTTAATAALRLWLEVEGVKDE